ncbi:hypothetical protein AB2L27_05440 [Kineococcus sp. LSe6-4]|uniref:Uncharacterized protein n=1 Tax=Kineococcus halophytocola TaxID=3234027 RepID=A0ABV4GZD3_9ACTN
MTALVALIVAFVALVALPLWVGLVFTAVAGLALFFAVREVFLGVQHFAGVCRTGR